MPTILDEIGNERARQIGIEGFGPSHDDAHEGGELASAAAAYAWGAACSAWHRKYGRESVPDGAADKIRSLWPWELHWLKPKTPRQDLIRAGALIVAEIERLDRASVPGRKE